MCLHAVDYRPPWWLRNRHLQTVLASSGGRRLHGARALRANAASTRPVLLEVGEGVRLQGAYSAPRGRAARGVALLLHGWEGSIDSSYMQMTAALLLARGMAVFRLNFRDHGDTHHLNVGLFHSARIDEVVRAGLTVADRFPARPLVAAGFSLGGNFALRLALRAPQAGLPLARVAAVCPVLDPARTMTRMETGAPWYLRHFERAWRASLRRKRQSFPRIYDFDDAVMRLPMRALTAWMVERYTTLPSLDAYFDAYALAGARLAGLSIPAEILTAADDPLIPVEDFRALRLSAVAGLEIARWGGHCGFLMNVGLASFAERWVAERLAAAII